ncbi:MAG: long-chain fatty acid--CoA ligase [Deltaproteobacteria bacterium]|nr:long-chain fatty acid--CoA ligase [Deltaproteobacteria bacterium]
MNDFSHKIERVDPETLSSMGQYTLPQILYKQAERFGSQKIAIREKFCGIWQTMDWRTYFRYTKNTALGLMALGIERGETVGFILDNGPEWLFGELGTHTAGAVALPLFASEPAEMLVSELDHAQAAYVFAQNQVQVENLLAHRQELPHVKQIIYIDPTGLKFYGDNPWLVAFSQLLELGEDLDNEQPDLFIKELWDGKPEDLAVMLRTADTTGTPKLAMLSHANFTATASRWVETEPMGIEDNWVSMFPMAGIVEQVWGVGISLLSGLTTNFPEGSETRLADFIDIGPTFITGSAEFWKNLASQITTGITGSGKWNRSLFHMALETANHTTILKSEKKSVPLQLRLKNGLLSRLISRPLLHRIGCSRIRAAYTGNHPVSPGVMRLFRSLGLNIKQCYGLTETCGMIHVHREGEVKPETVGRPLPGAEIKLTANREILIKSQSNFMGYYRDPDLTSRVLVDGWLYTGDTGTLDEDGHLRIIDGETES